MKGLNFHTILILIVFSNIYTKPFAQIIPVLDLKPKQNTVKVNVGFTHKLLGGKEYQAIKSDFRKLKKRLQLKAGAKVKSQNEESFYVRDVLNADQWYSINAIKILDGINVNLWLEKNAHDTLEHSLKLQNFISDFSEILFYKTPPQSVNPDEGILALLSEYAGKFPDVDNDGVLDVLLLDIRDNFEQTGGFVAGFFDPVNLVDHEFSNKRDLIYIDIYPTIFHEEQVNIERAASTLAHESQHLIHAGYEGKTSELVFINEGYSEAIEIIMGFPPRSAVPYLQNSLRPMFEWNHENPFPDYARASLWTHYLTEQLGASILPKLIQEELTGVDGIENILSKNGAPGFASIFENWGMALVLNETDKNPAWGYSHPDRNSIRIAPVFGALNLPEVLTMEQPLFSHALLSFPLTNTITLKNRSQDPALLHFNAISSYPDGSRFISIIPNSNSFEVDASDKPHGSIELLSSSIGAESISNDSTVVNLFATGAKSGVLQEWRYDDEVPDAFYLNASYLRLNSLDDALGIILPVKDTPYWLYAFSVQTLFLSELQGSGIAGDEERDFWLDIYTVKDGLPDQALITEKIIKVKRELGRLNEEVFSLEPYYNLLSNLKDSIAIVIRNDPDDDNYIAIAMDKGSGNYSMYGANMMSEPSWKSLAELNVGGNSLNNWNIIIGGHVVIPEIREQASVPIIEAEHTYKHVFVHVKPNVNYDSASVKVLAKLPDNTYIRGESTDAESFSVHTFKLPIQVGGKYFIHAQFTSKDGKIVFNDMLKWEIDVPDGFILGKNYPNPFNSVTNVHLVTLVDREVSWEVYDILGRVVQQNPPIWYESGEHTQSFNFSSLASGMYIIRAVTTNGRNSREILRHQKVILIK